MCQSAFVPNLRRSQCLAKPTIVSSRAMGADTQSAGVQGARARGEDIFGHEERPSDTSPGFSRKALAETVHGVVGKHWAWTPVNDQ
jgi:hypothetical protein